MTKINVFQSQPDKDEQMVRELFWEYLAWANDMNEHEFGIRLDIATMLEQDMVDLGKFLPPFGRLLLVQSNGETAGCVCLKELSASIGEVKRLYVRPLPTGAAVKEKNWSQPYYKKRNRLGIKPSGLIVQNTWLALMICIVPSVFKKSSLTRKVKYLEDIMLIGCLWSCT